MENEALLERLSLLEQRVQYLSQEVSNLAQLHGKFADDMASAMTAMEASMAALFQGVEKALQEPAE